MFSVETCRSRVITVVSLELLSRKLGEGSVGSKVAVRLVPVMTTTAFPIAPVRGGRRRYLKIETGDSVDAERGR